VVFATEQCWVREYPEVFVSSGGQVSAPQAERVARAVGGVLDRHGVTGGARVRLKTGNCHRGPMIGQVSLRVDGTPARAQAVASGVDDLAPMLARLDRQIESVRAKRWSPRPWPDLTRRLLSVRADAVIARRQSVVAQRATPMEAVAAMDAMDYDVHLFTDVETGDDAVVYRAGPSGLRLARQHHMFPPGFSGASHDLRPAVPLVVNSRPTPILAVQDAVRRAREYGLRFVFFTDPATGRGQLLYPRYDGNLGLLTPADGRDARGKCDSESEAARDRPARHS
jgi:hypothetical protein